MSAEGEHRYPTKLRATMFIKRRTPQVMIIICFLALLAALVWGVYKPVIVNFFSLSSNSEPLSAEAKLLAFSKILSSNSQKALTEGPSAQTSSSSSSSAISNSLKGAGVLPPGPLGEYLRKLLNSNQLTNIDYAWSRLRVRRTNAVKETSRPIEREKALARIAASAKPSPVKTLRPGEGNASYSQQVAAMDRLNELCNISIEGVPLAEREYQLIKAKPEYERSIAISKAVSGDKIDTSDVYTKEALTEVITSPMYSVLENILLTQLDMSAIVGAYRPDQIEVLSFLAAEILVCRMGDDCGPNGFTTLKFCEFGGICGGDLESAIWDNLKDSKVDTRAFRQFVDQRQQALNLLDFSILKKPK
jgi:hypothetical protein